MARPWWPFVERCPGEQGTGIVPHVRVYRLLYTEYADWNIIRPSKIAHLWWRFWWVRK